MRYTLEQYSNICADVSAQLRTMRHLHVSGREPFMCHRVNCSYCPFIGNDGVCPDANCPLDSSTWRTARTAEEWQKWLEWFATNNDPARPYTVEIPASAVDDIDVALNLGCVDTATAKLLESIQKQINAQNRN